MHAAVDMQPATTHDDGTVTGATPSGAEPSTPLERAQRRLIVRRLPLLTLGWVGNTLVWGLVESGSALLPTLVACACEIAVFIAAISACRRDPTARRVVPIAIVACVTLGLATTGLFLAVGGRGDVLAFALATLNLGAALTLAWGWKAELVQVGVTIVAWLLTLAVLPVSLSPLEIATGTAIGSVFALGLAEWAARSFRFSFVDRQSSHEMSHALAASHDAYRDLAENARDLIYTLDVEGRLTYVNDAVGRFMGRPVEALIGQSVRGFFSDHPANPDFDALLARITAGESLPPFLLHGSTATGERWVEADVSAIRNTRGAVVGVRGITRDVSERKQAEDALRASEERLRLVNTHSPIGIFMTDAEGLCTYTNPRCQAIYGFTLAESLGSGWARFVHPADRDRVLADSQRAIGEGMELTEEMRCRTPEGLVRWAYVRSSPMRSGDGELLGYVGSVEDITDRKRAVERIATQYAVTRALAESATLAEATPRILRGICESLEWKLGAIWRVDRDAGLLRCVDVWSGPSMSAPEFTAATRARTFASGIGLPGRVWASREAAWIADVTTDVNFPRAAIAAREGLHGAFGFPILLGGEVLGVIEFFSDEIELPDADLLAMLSATGSQIGQFIERRRAEEALRASEERYRGLVESQQDLISRFDVDGRLTFVNDALCAKFGVSRDAMVGNVFTSWLHPDDGAGSMAAIRALRSPPYRSNYENRARTADGWRWIAWESCAVRDERGELREFQAVGRDVTERKRGEEALRASLDELQQSEEKLRLLAQRQVVIREEERKRLGFDLHDDVCQELVGITILVESLRVRLAPLPAAAAAATAELDRIVRYLNEVVEHLRLLARELRPMLLHDLGLEGSLRSLADGMSSPATRVEATFPTAVPRLEENIELAVYRIAQEALANALRHAAARSITLSLAVDELTLRLEVQDDGCGFTTDERRRTEALGLVSMEERALALGGRLELESALGAGTTVRLACPLPSQVPATAA